MKALSIRQPWAWAIIYAGKDIENRSWLTNYRGPVLIHAAKAMTAIEYSEFCEFYERLQYARPLGRLPKMPGRLDLPRGGVIGMADLTGVVNGSTNDWFFGPFGFVLRNAKPLSFRPLKGNLGLFDVEEQPTTSGDRNASPQDGRLLES